MAATSGLWVRGKDARLRPLDIAKHGDGLYKAAIAGDAQTRFIRMLSFILL